MRQIIALMLLAWVHSALAAASTPQQAPQYEFVDLTDDFVAFFDRTSKLSQEERVAAFREDMVPLFPQFYGAQRYPDMPRERYEARISRALDKFPAIRADYLRTASAFQHMLQPAMNSFRQHFPDLASIPPVTLLHSLGEMDGGTRTFDGRTYFIFGADVMAAAHDFADEQPFLHHELFHVYHQQSFAECDKVWCSLWIEGLAVYAAWQLNPQASDAQLLLMQPEPIRVQVDAHLAEAVCAVKGRLESSQDEDLEALFSFRRLDARIPPRAGYYIGMLIAQRAAEQHSLKELAHLDEQAARPVVQRAIDALAVCE